MLKITCINCGKKYRVKEELKGETLKCPNCGMRIKAEEARDTEDVDENDLRAELMRLGGDKGGTISQKGDQASETAKSPANEDAGRDRAKKHSGDTDTSPSIDQNEHAPAGKESDTNVEIKPPRKNRTFLTISLLMLMILGLGGGFAYVQYQSYRQGQRQQRTADARTVDMALEKARSYEDPCKRGQAIQAWTQVQQHARHYERTHGDGQFVDAISKATSKIQQLQSAQRQRSRNINNMKTLLRQSKNTIEEGDYKSAANKLEKARKLGSEIECQSDLVQKLMAEINTQLGKPSIQYGGKGWVQYQGEWMPPSKKKKLQEEAKAKEMQDKGLVKYNGQWIKPEERDRREENKKQRRDRALQLDATRNRVRQKIGEGASVVQIDPDTSPLRWSAENWANPCQIEVTRADEDNEKFVRCNLEKGNKNKWVVSLEQNCNLQSYAELHVDIVSQDKVKLAAGIWTNPGYKLHEGKPKTIKTSETPETVVFDLTSQDFKSKKSKWRYNTSVENPDNVYKFSLFFYNQTKHPIRFRNVRVVRPSKDSGE